MLVTNLSNFLSVSMSLIILLNNPSVLFQGKKTEAIFFNYMVNFWTTVDENGSMIWNVTQEKISILYYFNDKNIDLQNILFLISVELMALTLRVGNFVLQCRFRIPNIGIMIISKELNSSVKNDFCFFLAL